MKKNSSYKKKTLVFGASLNPMRVSHMAVQRLQGKGLPVVAIGGRTGMIGDINVHKGNIEIDEIHTITLYMSEKRQSEYIEYLLSLKPKRIIFNPGAENMNFFLKARDLGIEVLNACTLVMLSTGQY